MKRRKQKRKTQKVVTGIGVSDNMRRSAQPYFTSRDPKNDPEVDLEKDGLTEIRDLQRWTKRILR